MLVDIGSSMDIMLYNYFNKLGLENMDLALAPHAIKGFIRCALCPIGVVRLPIKLGGRGQIYKLILDCVVMDRLSI